MSLLSTPRPTPIPGQRRVHRLDGPGETEEGDKETTVPRIKKATEATPPAAKAPGKRRGPKPGSKREKAIDGVEAVFGVYEDGSVVINAPDCKGRLDHALADRLVKFIGKLQRK
jgi:hypothetical protein